MSRDEITKGIANRFVHSRSYIVLYLVMAALSVTTVVLSLMNGCPTLPFYILELIINGAMILEVTIRFIAFGRVRGPASACRCCVREKLTTLRYTAVLEKPLQHNGSHSHRILCHHACCDILRGL